MADRSKLIYVNADSDNEESSFADSLKYTSFKTANFELTDVLLGQLTNDVILRTGTRAFTADQSMGGNKLTNVGNAIADNDAANYGQVRALFNGFDWKQSVRAVRTTALPAVTYSNGTSGVGATLTADANGALPSIDGVTLVVNDRVLIMGQAAGLQNGIYIVTQVGDGSNPFILTRATDADQAAEVTASMTVPISEGTTYADYYAKLLTNDTIVIGTTALTFQTFSATSIVAGAGIAQTAETISVDFLTGGGLKFVGAGDAAQLAVEPADFAGLGLQDDGSDNLEIDFYDPGTASELTTGSRAPKITDLYATGAGQGAKVIGVENTTALQAYTSATVLQTVLEDLALGIARDDSVAFTAGTGGVAKGDLVYISGNNEVRKLPISGASSEEVGIGVIEAAASASAACRVRSDGEVITGVLTSLSAVANDRIFWDGSALTKTQPSASGAYVWEVGVAKNADDLYVNVRFKKKNS